MTSGALPRPTTTATDPTGPPGQRTPLGPSTLSRPPGAAGGGYRCQVEGGCAKIERRSPKRVAQRPERGERAALRARAASATGARASALPAGSGHRPPAAVGDRLSARGPLPEVVGP